MKKALSSAMAVVIVCSAASAFAASFPVPLVLNTAASNILIQLKLPPEANPIDIPLTFAAGSWDTTIEQTGTAPPPVSLSSVIGTALANNTVVNAKVLNLFPGTITATDIVLSTSPGGPFLNIAPTLTGGTIDLSGLELGLTGGSFGIAVPALAVNEAFDFDEDPLFFELPDGTLATINESGGPQLYSVSLSIPVSLEVEVEDVIGETDLLVVLTGVLVFEGVKAIPEPGSIALLGIGLIGLGLPAVRRYRRK